jgi:hypothetical protein
LTFIPERLVKDQASAKTDLEMAVCIYVIFYAFLLNAYFNKYCWKVLSWRDCDLLGIGLAPSLSYFSVLFICLSLYDISVPLRMLML